VRTQFEIMAAALAFIALPFAAQAQGVVQGANEGAYEGNRAAGPVGGAVGGVAGGAIGGVVGGIDGVLGIRHYNPPLPQRSALQSRLPPRLSLVYPHRGGLFLP